MKNFQSNRIKVSKTPYGTVKYDAPFTPNIDALKEIKSEHGSRKKILHGLPFSHIPLFLLTAMRRRPEVALAIYFGIFGGIRVGEVCNIRHQDISTFIGGENGEYGLLIPDLRTRIVIEGPNGVTNKQGKVKKAREQKIYNINNMLYWRVLDIATGGGHTAKSLAHHVAQVFATDLTREMLVSAHRHVEQHADNVWFIVADAENLPFLDGSFDAVTCRIAAHHFPHPERFIQEAARVLKPGGKLLLIDNTAPDDELDEFINTVEKLRDESHVRCYRSGEWTTWMEEVGLQVLNSRVRKKHLAFTPWVLRTTRSQEQVETVVQYISTSDQRVSEYFGLVLNDGNYSALDIEEWMVLLVKPA
jgi:ubiquinone/menaquinone biosynthesis C-methylase UbiE